MEPVTQPHGSKTKDYIPDENDKILRQWLNDWRQESSEDAYGKIVVRYFGCSSFMPNNTLERICDAAHYDLIASIDDLNKETHWHLAD